MIFAHLHCKSCYSFLKGANKPAELAKAAARRGVGALALTEFGGLYSAVAHQRVCIEAGVKPIFGVEIPAFRAEESEESANENFVLLARNGSGWSKISSLITSYATGKAYNTLQTLEGCDDIYLLGRDQPSLSRAKETIPAGRIFAELVIHSDEDSARRLARWAEENEVPVVATNDVYFIDSADQEIAAILSAIRLLKTIGTLAPGDVPSAQAYLASAEEMEHRFRWCPSAMANAAAIADDCNFLLELGVRRLPKYDRSRSGSSLAELRQRCLEALPRRYFNGKQGAAVRRLGKELGVVAQMGFADYLLMVHDIVLEAERRGIRTFGRGSAAASIICYLLRITHVEPIRYQLVFERFMNEARSDLPDIDLDFPWNRRDEMVEFVYQRFGHDRVAMIATYNTFRARGGMREVAKAFGIPEAEVGRVTKRIPHIRTEALEGAAKQLPECKDLPLQDEPWKTVSRIARRIDGFPRHMSVHPCGLVIAPSRLDRIVPLEMAAKGLIVTQMDMYPVEDLGLVKMDLLGQRALAVISDSIEVINSRNGKTKSLEDLVLDTRTKKMLKKGDSMGCFYVESPGMRSLMAKLKVEDFELLTAASSVIRPGPSDSGMMKAFVERHCRREPVKLLHRSMKRVLGDTYGVMIYQEDVMRVAHEVAGMSLADADQMWRSMTKKRFHEPLVRMKERFLAGAAKKGIEKDVSEEIWRQVASFAGYAFCKSHSASFAQVSIQSAHIKAHYPAEFMAAVLTNEGGFYSAAAYIQEARRMGLRILPPYVGKAKVGYQGGRDVLMVGLMAVKNLSRNTMGRIVENRPYDNLQDFLAKVRPAHDEAESLIAGGALDRFSFSRPQMMWLIRDKVKQKDENPLLDMVVSEPVPPEVPDYSFEERLRREMEALDFTVTAHPLALYQERQQKENAVPASAFQRHRGRAITALGWLVHSKRTRTHRGEYMMFLSMEDLSSAFEAVLFPGSYERYGSILRGHGPYLLFGKIVSDAGVLSLNVRELQNLG